MRRQLRSWLQAEALGRGAGGAAFQEDKVQGAEIQTF
jgi:hypothetical protein